MFKLRKPNHTLEHQPSIKEPLSGITYENQTTSFGSGPEIHDDHHAQPPQQARIIPAPNEDSQPQFYQINGTSQSTDMESKIKTPISFAEVAKTAV